MELHEILLKNFILNADDYTNAGLIKNQLENHEDAINLYEKALSLNPDNIHALNNLGFTLGCVLGRYERSLELLK